MRKLMIALAFVGLSTSAIAQETTEVPVRKYSVATNSFWANWYLSLGGNFNASYTSEENCSNKNPFSVDRGTFGFDVAIGKWFTPSIGLRTKFQGLWAKQVIDRDTHHSYKLWNVHEDVTFNLSNMIFGYNKNRVWNFIPYVGLGLTSTIDPSNLEFSYNFGIWNTFRITDRWAANFEVYAAFAEGNADNADPDNWNKHAKFTIRHWDKQVGLSVGVTYNFCKKYTWEKTPDVAALMAMNQEQVDALNNSLKEQQDENARLRDMLANQKPVETVVERSEPQLVATAQSVFFNIGSSKIASRKDLVNVKEVADYAKANNKKILVTGYADSKTGSTQFNQQLSQKRAEAVANELVKMGVDRDNIVIEAKGGVNTISPYSYNRRATVQLM